MAYDDNVLANKNKKTTTEKTPMINTTFNRATGGTQQTPSSSTNATYKPVALPAKPTPTINPAYTTKPAAPQATYTPPSTFHNNVPAPTSNGSSYAQPVTSPTNYTPVTPNSGGYTAPSNTPTSPTPAESVAPTEPKASFDDTSTPLQLNPQQQESQAQAIQSVDTVMGGYQQIMQDAKSMGNEGLMALAAQQEKMTAMLDGIEAQITNQIKGQMNGDDPAMQNAIKLIRAEADKMRAETLDELNARGLVQSGVYARALSDMNNGELTQVQTAITSRFSDLQTQLNNAVMSLAQTRISALAANQTAVASMITNTQNNVLSTGLAGMNSAVTVRGQDIQSNYNNKALDQNQNQYNSTLQYNKDQSAQSSKQFYDQLSQADKQFYDQLSQNEKLALMSAARGGGSSGSSLDQQKFDFTVQQYKDGLAAGEQANTYQQVAQAMAADGMVEQMIGKIKSGTYTVGQVRSIISGSGMTQGAQYQILNAITSDAGVQKKISTTKSNTPSYTPKSSTTTGGYMYK